MKRILKYAFAINQEFTLYVPIDSIILDVQVQRTSPVIWFMVDDDKKGTSQKRSFRIYGTGHPILDIEELTYIKTFQMNGGDLVWHLFEVKK